MSGHGHPGGAVATETDALVTPKVLVGMTGMAKAFGATQAIVDASFELRAGEVHALVG